MSNSLSPWILEFLLKVANTFGAKIYNVQPYVKKKKVQITEFLTYSDEDDIPIWARMSDKKHIITVKFSKDAGRMFKEGSGKHLTQNKGAIVSISQFRPISSRFPLGGGRTSTEAFVVFECDHISLVGSPGEPTFGQPKAIEQERDIDLWCRGLAQGGGAGNILKERMLEAEGKKPGNATVLPPMPTPPAAQASLCASDVKPKTIVKRVDDTDLASHKARWQFLERGRQAFMGPNQLTTTKSPIQEKSALSASTQKMLEPDARDDRSRSATPISNWNSSPYNNRKGQTPVEDEEEEEKGADMEFDDAEALPAPTPAQRMKKPTDSPPEASLHLGNETQMSPRTRSPLARKVPRPVSPEPLPAEQTGAGRILVPNSDTSQQSNYSQGLHAKPNERPLYLGGLVKDTSGGFPWLPMRDIGRIWRTASELRLHNDSH